MWYLTSRKHLCKSSQAPLALRTAGTPDPTSTPPPSGPAPPPLPFASCQARAHALLYHHTCAIPPSGTILARSEQRLLLYFILGPGPPPTHSHSPSCFHLSNSAASEICSPLSSPRGHQLPAGRAGPRPVCGDSGPVLSLRFMGDSAFTMPDRKLTGTRKVKVGGLEIMSLSTFHTVVAPALLRGRDPSPWPPRDFPDWKMVTMAQVAPSWDGHMATSPTLVGRNTKQTPKQNASSLIFMTSPTAHLLAQQVPEDPGEDVKNGLIRTLNNSTASRCCQTLGGLSTSAGPVQPWGTVTPTMWPREAVAVPLTRRQHLFV